MQKSIIYCRVSSERQKTEGHGLDSQEHRCQEWAERKGYQNEMVFRDSYSGGGDFFNRPAMSELLKYLDAHRHTSYVVIFDDLKRFARDTVFHWKLRQEFTSRNAKLECLNFTFEDTPEGRFIETILAGQGQLEREQNRRQVVQKMKARLEAGYWSFSDCPPGYEYIKDPAHGKIPVLNRKAVIVKEALEGYASGRFTEQEDIRKFLEEKKIQGGKPVYLDYVKRMLTRVFYAGYIEYPPWEVSRRQAKHEPIISIEVYERIQQRLKGKSTTHIKKILNDDFPLRGFVLCSECKQPLTASWSTGRNKKFPYYRCKTKGCIERNKSINREEMENSFQTILGKIKPSESVLALTKAIVSDLWMKKEGEILLKMNSIDKELRSLENEKRILLERITKALDENVIQAYEVKISEISDNMAVLKSSSESFSKHRPDIGTALGIVFDFLQNPLKRWKDGDIHTKKLVLRLVFEQNLEYNRKSGFGTAFLSLPLRVFTLPKAQKSSVVHLVVESWNHLPLWIFEASEAIIERRKLEIA